MVIKPKDLVAESHYIYTNLIEKAKQGTPEQPIVVLNPYGWSPLTAAICFCTAFDTQYRIKVDDVIILSNRSRLHMLPVIGLKAGKSNQVYYGEGKVLNQVVVIETDILPETVPVFKSDGFSNESSCKYGYMALTADGNSLPAIWNSEGRCLWYGTKQLSHFSTLLPNGHLLVGAPPNVALPYGPTSLWEIDLLGRIYAEYRLPRGVSNDATLLPNGELVAISQGTDKGTVMDTLIWFNLTSGEITKEVSFSDYLPVGFGSAAQSGSDWLHLSSVRYEEQENRLWVSAEHLNALMALDASTGRVLHIFAHAELWPKGPWFKNLVDLGQKNWLTSPVGAIGSSDEVLVAVSNDDQKEQKKFALVRFSLFDGKIIEYLEVDIKGKSRVLNDLIAVQDGFYLHYGACDNLGHKVSLFCRQENLKSKEWSYGRKVNFQLESLACYQISAATYGLWRVEFSQLSFSGNEKGVIGNWLAAMEVDVTLPVEEIETDTDGLFLSFTHEGDRILVKATFLQGEATAVILKQGEKQRAYYIQSNRRPHGANWLMSETSRPERPVCWAIPTTGLKGFWEIEIWIDGTLFKTGVQLDLD